MDIQKEVMEFKSVATSMGWNVDGEKSDNGYKFYCLTTNSGWEMWQAAKAQTIPESFVLVPKEPTEKILSKAIHKYLEVNDLSIVTNRMYHVYKAMIEAAEGK